MASDAIDLYFYLQSSNNPYLLEINQYPFGSGAAV